MSTTAIYWLKRDFRLSDNPALTAALASHGTVTPVFILEPSALAAPETSALHVHAQCDAFNGLYERLGGALATPTPPLGFAHAEVVDCLDQLWHARPFDSLHSHQETGGNRTYDRDKAVARWCQGEGGHLDGAPTNRCIPRPTGPGQTPPGLATVLHRPLTPRPRAARPFSYPGSLP